MPDTSTPGFAERTEILNRLYLSRGRMGCSKVRRIVLMLMFAMGIASQAMAATRVNIYEMEQMLSAAQGESDGKVAKQLSGLKLTERASSIRLVRWETQFPGKHCHEALTMLADASAFLDLPAADMPANAPPDLQAQKTMLLKTIDYVNSTITRLPNFYATRKTEYFEESPAATTMEAVNISAIGRGSRSG